MVCKVINNSFSILIQAVLGFFALLSLAVKRISENPKRPINVFLYDISKQVIGSLYTHGLNLLIAIKVSSLISSDKLDDECMWYFVNFIVDVFLGLVLNWIFLTLVNWIANKYKYHMLISGKYTIDNKFCNIPYALQLAIWLIIITIVKILLFYGFLIPAQKSLGEMGTWILSPIYGDDEFELIVVMVVVPFTLNIFQFWLQDTILKDSKPKKRIIEVIEEVIEEDINIDNGNANSNEFNNLDSKISTKSRYLQIDETNITSSQTFRSL